MAMPSQAPPDCPTRLRRLWQHWGRVIIIVVVAHIAIGGIVIVLFRLSLPPPPRYVVVDLLPPSAQAAPTPASTGPSGIATDAPAAPQ